MGSTKQLMVMAFWLLHTNLFCQGETCMNRVRTISQLSLQETISLAMTVRYRIYLHQINPQQICPCWEKWCPWHQHRRKENLTFHIEVAWVKPKPWRDERHSDGDQRRKKNQWRWPPSRPQNLNFFFCPWNQSRVLGGLERTPSVLAKEIVYDNDTIFKTQL